MYSQPMHSPTVDSTGTVASYYRGQGYLLNNNYNSRQLLVSRLTALL